MSEGSGKNEMANALGGVAAVVIVIVFIVVGIGKLLTWIWLNLLAPLFLGTVFYALPFVVASGVMGGLSGLPPAALHGRKKAGTSGFWPPPSPFAGF